MKRYNFIVFLYRILLRGFQRLILEFVDNENNLHHENEIVGCIKLNLCLFDNNLVHFLINSL